MTVLMLHYSNPNSIWIHLPKIDDVREAPHKTATNVIRDDHPPFRLRGQDQHLSFKFIDELPAQAGRLILLIGTDGQQLRLYGGGYSTLIDEDAP